MKKNRIFERLKKCVLSVCLGGVMLVGMACASVASEFMPSDNDPVIFVTAEGLAVRKNNGLLYVNVAGQTYEVLGQGGGELGYQILEYIECDDSQYINTAFTHSATTKVETKINVKSNYSVDYIAIFGARLNTYKSNAMGFFTRFANVDQAVYFRTGVEKSGSNMLYDQDIVLECEGNVATWTNGKNTYSINAGGTINAGQTPMFLFNLNMGQSAGALYVDRSFSCLAKMYYFRIWDNGVLVRNFVPMQNPSGVNGLYDYCNGTFYASARAGTNFVAGPKVEGGIYQDNSYAGNMIGSDVGVREIGGVEFVAGAQKGYLLCRDNASGELIHVRI